MSSPRTWLLVNALALSFSGCRHSTESASPIVSTAIAPTIKPVAHGSSPNRFSYPPALRTDVIDRYGQTKVADPYRWLENPDSPETRSWIEAQNTLTFDYLDHIPQRETIRKRITALWNYERYSAPLKKGGRYFFLKNDGLQNQSVLYTVNTLDQPPHVLLDPNLLSKEGTIALADDVVSEDGKYIAYGLQQAGSDWSEWRIRKIDSGKDYPEVLRWIKFNQPAWTPDNKGFFYSRYPEPKTSEKLAQANYNQKIWYHRLGTSQRADRLIFQNPKEKDWGYSNQVTDDGRYLIITVWKGTAERYRIFYKDLKRRGKIVPLITEFENRYDFVGNKDSTFYFHTDLNAPRGRLVAIDINQPQSVDWETIIPQSEDTLTAVSLVGSHFIAQYLKDAHSVVKIFSHDGDWVRDVALPGLGTASGFAGEPNDAESFFEFTSFTTPSTIFRYDVSTGQSTLFRQPKVDFNSADYVTEQIFYTSKDGTRVPMFISRRKDRPLKGNLPTHLYGYGGFNISITPYFRAENLVWMEMGGVFAVANLRGGGEYGEQWHAAGTKLKKQNVFDDFIAAGEWLIANGVTSKEKLGISGRSNGGLLIGAVLNQRPDLFGAAIPGVGVMDMLRFHKFTIGWAWVDDYGSSDDPAVFQTLYAYSPYHNIKEQVAYPSTLIITADHDDRVVPGHSFKYAAALQRAQSGDDPILIRIETEAGHGAGKPTSKRIDEATDMWAFFARELGIQLPENY